MIEVSSAITLPSYKEIFGRNSDIPHHCYALGAFAAFGNAPWWRRSYESVIFSLHFSVDSLEKMNVLK